MNLQEKQNLISSIVREEFYKDNRNHIKEDLYYQKHHIYKVFILDDIKFLNTVSHRWGVCQRRKHIYNFCFNKTYIENATEEQCRNLALHEVAHAINYIQYLGKGHDNSFYRVLKNLGSTSIKRCDKEPTDKMAHIVKYVYQCNICGKLFVKAHPFRKSWLHSKDRGNLLLVKVFDKKQYMSDEEVKALEEELKVNLKVA